MWPTATGRLQGQVLPQPELLHSALRIRVLSVVQSCGPYLRERGVVTNEDVG
jgi:hypothetical protein